MFIGFDYIFYFLNEAKAFVIGNYAVVCISSCFVFGYLATMCVWFRFMCLIFVFLPVRWVVLDVNEFFYIRRLRRAWGQVSGVLDVVRVSD